ncbi:MAG: DAK2 domain-containing protein [Bacillota bacterium]|nr:DAK2 domain-containing protein [Bacillota bacterium]
MPESIKHLDGALLCKYLRGGCAYLGEHKDEVNALNVFPVPDGDTGINMYLTVSSAGEKLPRSGEGLSVGKIAGDFSMGTLMGARGNSGVILSQIFRGLAVSMNGQEILDARGFAAALQKGVDLSYKSVMKPVEGTILTVFREYAAAAEAAAQAGADVITMLKKAAHAGEEALARTPEILPVLKEAGVVDAGGKGILVFLAGALSALTGEYVREEPAAVPVEPLRAASLYSGPAACDGEIEFAFCTQLLIRGEKLPLDTIREHLSQTPPGDSLLVVGDEQIIKIHFHNNQPWKVLEYCAQFGSLHDIIIDNMRDQHHETQISAAEAAAAETATPEPAAAKPKLPAAACGVIAVCSGQEMIDLYQELGAMVISGGQTMNPSAEDLLRAIAECPAEEIVILPNNSNIILAADQAKQLAEKPVEVVRSKFVTQGISAMMGFDSMQSAGKNRQAMEGAAANTVNGELTYAVRDTKCNGFEIKNQDVLALLQGDIVDNGPSLEEMLLSLVGKMSAASSQPELLSLFYGNDMPEEEAAALSERVQEAFPQFDVELRPGGQPLYYFLLSLE